MSRARVPLLLALVAVLTSAAASGVRAAEAPLAVLFLHGNVTSAAPGTEAIFARRGFLPDATLQDKLAAEKIVWGAENFSTQLSWDFLKQFNVIVLLDFPVIEKHPNEEAKVRAAEALLARFVAEGGGLMCTGNTEYGMWALERDFEELNRYLTPFGGQVLHEQVDEQDAGKILESYGGGRLAWTGNVSKSPLTEGVRGLLYPIDHAWSYWTHPVQVDPQWQVLLRALPSANTFTRQLGGGTALSTEDKKAGTIASAPPLLAVRDSGKGRLALWPEVPTAFIIDGYHPFWGGGIIMEGNKQGMPSDGRALLLNLLRWLGEPSRGSFGGYRPPPEVGTGDEVGFQAVDWDAVKLEGRSQPNTYRGLIGLRSSLSGGAAKPEELIGAAREARYDFAAFTEDLAAFTAEKLATLTRVCLAASDDKFQAYPGFRYRDESGNSWATFGRSLSWPKPEWWSKRRPGALELNNFVFRGYQYPPVIMLAPHKNPEPAVFQGNYKGFALQTYQAGKLVDDATDVYNNLQRNGFNVFPVAVNEVETPEQVRAAAALPVQTYMRWWELADVLAALSGNVAMHQGAYVWDWSAFVSSGPLIRDLRVFNFGTADLAVPNNDRYRVRLDLESEKGLKEVALYEGDELVRRIALRGEKTWVGEIEGYQDRDRHWVAVVTDLAGGQATSAPGWTDVQETMLVRCTDNLNTYTSGKFKAVTFHALRGMESYIDQQAGQFNYFPSLEAPETERPAVEQRIVASSRFGFVREDVCDYFYPATASANWNRTDTPECAAAQTLIKGRTRVTMFSPRAGGTSAFLVEGDYAMLRDLDLPSGKIPVYRTNWIADARTIYVSRRNGPATCANLELRSPYCSGTLDGADYVAQIAPFGGSRAVAPLQEGMGFDAIYNNGRSYLGVSVTVPEKKLLRGQGDQVPLPRRLGHGQRQAGRAVHRGPLRAARAARQARLRGAARPRAGCSTPATLCASEPTAEGFSGTVSRAALPFALPVYVEGLNDRWAAGILYRGKNDLLVPVWKTDKVGDRTVEQVKTPGKDQLLRFAVQGGVGMLQLDTEFGERRVYIGNLLVCDQPEVFLGLDDARPRQAGDQPQQPDGPGVDGHRQARAGLRVTGGVEQGP